jgi:putative transposase
MIGALKQIEAGRSAAEVGRELGVSKHTVYAWEQSPIDSDAAATIRMRLPGLE